VTGTFIYVSFFVRSINAIEIKVPVPLFLSNEKKSHVAPPFFASQASRPPACVGRGIDPKRALALAARLNPPESGPDEVGPIAVITSDGP
jgi:hypothetical protein